jgi:hypothetical protein
MSFAIVSGSSPNWCATNLGHAEPLGRASSESVR